MPWQPTIQDALAAVIILWAVWYLARRVRGIIRRQRATACGTCPGCRNSAPQQPAAKAFVPLDALSQSAAQDTAARS